MEKKTFSLYIHTNKINGKRYIGITRHPNPKQRWGAGGCKYKGSTRFWNAIQKYGWENFEHEIRLTGLTKEDAEEREIFYISLFRTLDDRFGYNISKGGKSNDQGKNSGTNEYDRERYHKDPRVCNVKKTLAKAYYEAHKEERQAYNKMMAQTPKYKERKKQYMIAYRAKQKEMKSNGNP